MKPVACAAWLFLFLSGFARAAAASTAPPPDSSNAYSLLRCLQIAIDHNPQLRAASTLLLGAEGRAITLHAILYPKINAQALSTPTTFFVQIQETLYNRATLPQLRISQLTQEQARINYRQTLTDVTYQVRQTFLSALGTQARVALVRNYLAQEAKALTSAQHLFEAGQVQKNAVLGIQVKVELAKRQQSDTELQYTEVLLALGNVLGQDLPASARLTGELLTEEPPGFHAKALVKTAWQNRSDLKELESMQLSDKQQIEVDTRDAYPIVNLAASGAFQAPAIGPLSTGGYDLERNYNEPQSQRQSGDSQVMAGVYLTWRIFDGGAVQGIKSSDTAQIASRDVALEELRQSIAQEVNSAVTTMAIQSENLRALNALAPQEQLRGLADLQVKTGEMRQLDIAYLEDDLLLQQQQRITARYEMSEAAAELDHALGDGLEPFVDPMRP